MFRTKEDWLGKTYHTLEDIIKRNLDILFVGISPSLASVELGHYQQGMHGRRFWSTVIHGGLVKPKAGWYTDEILLQQGMGITDLVKRPARSLKQINRSDFSEGRKRLFEKIVYYKPKIVCAIYKAVAEKFFMTNFTNVHGFQEKFRIGESRVFILAPFFYPPAQREKTIEELIELRNNLSDKNNSG